VALRNAGIDADIVASSSAWGIEKPSPVFFERITSEADLPPGCIAYVGDRYDNDINPAHHSGLVPIHIQRGPWAHISDQSGASCARVTIKSLVDLPATLTALD
jgi:FMN phosphatase YigB (HAD superfamily)